MAKDAGATTTKSVGALRKAMKKAREAWRANKEDKSLKKKFRKAKKALEAAKEAAKGSAAPSAEAKKAKKKKEKKRKQAGENHDSANGDAKSVKKKKKAKNKKEKSKKQAAASPGEGNVSSSATASEIKAFREENKIKLQGKAVEGAQPFLSFSDLKFPKKYLYALQGFEKPTPIQAEAWPLALKGRDIIGIAATGKSAHDCNHKHIQTITQTQAHRYIYKNGLLMLVLSPTRELAQQTNRVCEAVCKGCGIRSVCVIGGMDKWKMAQQFRGGMHVLVATPGRLLGFVREGEICLANVEYAVLDEADRMLDMGFEPDVRKIMSMVKKSDERQTLLFSATWPQEVQKLGLEFVQNPVIIYIGDRGEKLVANKRVSQTIEVIEESRRDHRLHQLLEKYHNGTNRVIVFALYKKEAARVETMLRRRGWKVQSIHGDKSQDARTAALNRFKDGSEVVCGPCSECMSQ
eukprot:jgi/Bigna1/80656/fgenesh1_pg.73_\